MLYNTKSFYCNIKDKVPHGQRNHVIYKIKCPGCNDCYISKTERCLMMFMNDGKIINYERCLITRITDHGTKETEPMFKHLFQWELFKDCCWMYSLLLLVNKDEHDNVSLTSQIFNAVT